MSKPAPDPQLPLLPLGAAVSFHVCDPEAKDLAAAAGGALDAASADTAGCLPIHVEEGLAFELNNRLPHYVDNNSDQVRVCAEGGGGR